jgi:hypothetical protein
MLYERQKLLISMLDTMGGQIGATDFQKLLFLYTKEFENTATYDFVPYKRGCFSFTSYADKRKLIDKGYLSDDPNAWKLTEEGSDVARQSPRARAALDLFRQRYGSIRGNALIGEVYRHYPYFATRSEIVDEVVKDDADRERIEEARPVIRRPGLLTIGYEGKNLESYLNQLLKAGVTVLCDVRRNALSRKYGFSKKTLSNACQNVGIRYEHLPELGIASAKRKNLRSQDDYDRLFAAYEVETLRHQTGATEKINQWVTRGRERVALTCYELNPRQCHRQRVAVAVETNLGKEQKTEHL